MRQGTTSVPDGNVPRNFALIGAAGYVAPRHMRAIRDTGNRLIAAVDKAESVGILDSFSFDVAFFTEFERFDRHAEKMRRQGEEKRIHYTSICSPNYLHDAHVRFSLRIGATAICEKPLVLTPWNLDALAELEQETGVRVYNVLQLRVHPSIVALREKIRRAPEGKKYAIDLAYITSRGVWYFVSWKGDVNKSGGIASNIGIHFFDMLLWTFGAVQRAEVHHADSRRMAGFLELEKARVRWFLSLRKEDLPEAARKAGKTTYRSMTVDEEEFDFSEGFMDLHTEIYREIFAGRGFGIDDARLSIHLVYELRNALPVRSDGPHQHPFLKNP
jgi:UDP-N-acetyl-2-amino-2-deoxyglucuronate dehydrogenase